MQTVKEKLSNMASSVKKPVNIFKAKVEEKAEKAAARREEDIKMADKSGKGKGRPEKTELHEAKAEDGGEKLSAKYQHGDLHVQQPVGVGTPLSGGAIPAYPLGGLRPGHKY